MLGLRTTIYKVSDLLKAKSWYAKAFETQPYFDEPFYVGFNIGGYELGLLPEEENQTARKLKVHGYPRDYPRDPAYRRRTGDC